MRCPKCGFVSFEYLDSCKKCSKDLFEFKEKAGIAVMEPAFLDLNQFTEGGAGEDATEEIGEDAGEMEFSEEATLGDDISEEAGPSQTENLLDSLDMGEENGISLDLGADMESGTDLTGDAEDTGLSLSTDAEEGEISLDLADEEEGISLEESPESETSAEESTDEGGINLTMDEEDLSLSPESEEGSISMTTEEEEPSVNLTFEEESASEESPELEIALEEEGISLELSEEDAPSEESGEMDLSLDIEENESGEGGTDGNIEDEIDLMLEGLEDEEPKDS